MNAPAAAKVTLVSLTELKIERPGPDGLTVEHCAKQTTKSKFPHRQKEAAKICSFHTVYIYYLSFLQGWA